MDYAQLGEAAKRHIDFRLLPQRVELKTKLQRKLIAWRGILLFLALFAAIAGAMESKAYFIGSGMLLCAFLLALAFSHFLILDSQAGEAYFLTRFAGKTVAKGSIVALPDVCFTVQPVPGLAQCFQFTVCQQRFSVGSMDDAEAAALFLAGQFGCVYQRRAAAFATPITTSFAPGVMAPESQIQHHAQPSEAAKLGTTPSDVLHELKFWAKGAVFKQFAAPLVLFIVLGLVARALKHGI